VTGDPLHGGGVGKDAVGGVQELADQLVDGDRGGAPEGNGWLSVSPAPARSQRRAGSCQVTRPARAERGVPGQPADRFKAKHGSGSRYEGQAAPGSCGRQAPSRSWR
jgi:hypothetical protein